MQELFRKAQAGELPFSAQLISESGEPSSMQIEKVVVVQNGAQRVLSDETLTLSTNSIDGDRAPKSIACVSLPVDGSTGSISTFGNATVSNCGSLPSLKLSGGAPKIHASSISGGFAVAQIKQQRDTQLEYFDFLFGTKGQPETIDDVGRKNRSHVALHPDGNGKFLRLEGSGCEITSELNYYAETKSILPRKVNIRSPQFLETLVAQFTSTDVAVELVSIAFEVTQGDA